MAELIETPLLAPGCIMCGATIPEKAAKMRSKVCSQTCRAAYRKWRNAPPAKRTQPLFCQVCRKEIPNRPNVTWAETCSRDCRNEMRRFRWAILKMQKCPHCYHPSTPAEWEDYRRWRANKGSIRAQIQIPGRGRPRLTPQEKEIREALQGATRVAKGYRDRILVKYRIKKVEELNSVEIYALNDVSKEEIARYAADRETVIEMETLIDQLTRYGRTPEKTAVDTAEAS